MVGTIVQCLSVLVLAQTSVQMDRFSHLQLRESSPSEHGFNCTPAAKRDEVVYEERHGKFQNVGLG
jgi:hypothetical protein